MEEQKKMGVIPRRFEVGDMVHVLGVKEAVEVKGVDKHGSVTFIHPKNERFESIEPGKVKLVMRKKKEAVP